MKILGIQRSSASSVSNAKTQNRPVYSASSFKGMEDTVSFGGHNRVKAGVSALIIALSSFFAGTATASAANASKEETIDPPAIVEQKNNAKISSEEKAFLNAQLKLYRQAFDKILAEIMEDSKSYSQTAYTHVPRVTDEVKTTTDCDRALPSSKLIPTSTGTGIEDGYDDDLTAYTQPPSVSDEVKTTTDCDRALSYSELVPIHTGVGIE